MGKRAAILCHHCRKTLSPNPLCWKCTKEWARAQRKPELVEHAQRIARLPEGERAAAMAAHEAEREERAKAEAEQARQQHRANVLNHVARTVVSPKQLEVTRVDN